MRTHDPFHHEDHTRPRRESWALRLLWVMAALALLTCLLSPPLAVALTIWTVIVLIGVVAVLIMIPWGGFGQPDHTDDDPDHTDDEGVYPS